MQILELANETIKGCWEIHFRDVQINQRTIAKTAAEFKAKNNIGQKWQMDGDGHAYDAPLDRYSL